MQVFHLCMCIHNVGTVHLCTYICVTCEYSMIVCKTHNGPLRVTICNVPLYVYIGVMKQEPMASNLSDNYSLMCCYIFSGVRLSLHCIDVCYTAELVYFHGLRNNCYN